MQLIDLQLLFDKYDEVPQELREKAVITFLSGLHLTARELQTIFTELKIPNRTHLLKLMPTPHRYFYGDKKKKSIQALETVSKHIDFKYLIERYIQTKTWYTFNWMSYALNDLELSGNGVDLQIKLSFKVSFKD